MTKMHHCAETFSQPSLSPKITNAGAAEEKEFYAETLSWNGGRSMITPRQITEKRLIDN